MKIRTVSASRTTHGMHTSRGIYNQHILQQLSAWNKSVLELMGLCLGNRQQSSGRHRAACLIVRALESDSPRLLGGPGNLGEAAIRGEGFLWGKDPDAEVEMGRGGIFFENVQEDEVYALNGNIAPMFPSGIANAIPPWGAVARVLKVTDKLNQGGGSG